MNIRPVVIGTAFIGGLIFFILAYHGVFVEGVIREDNLTLRHCTGDRFAFIQGTYQDPVTEEEIARGKKAVILRVRTADGTGPRAGGSGGGGPGGAGDCCLGIFYRP
jgi:hypothetical protein